MFNALFAVLKMRDERCCQSWEALLVYARVPVQRTRLEA